MVMLEKLPDWAEHLLIVLGTAFAASVGTSVLDAGGVSSVEWPSVLLGSVDTAFVATVSVALVLYITPLSRKYGVGSGKKDTSDRFDVL